MLYRKKPKSLIALANKYRVKGYLVFRTAHTTFFRWFLPKGYGHVHAVIEHNGYKVLIDSTISHSVAQVYPDGYDYDLQPDETVIRFDRFVDTTQKNYHFGFMSCVEVVKRFLGIKERFIFTPHQLYRALK